MAGKGGNRSVAVDGRWRSCGRDGCGAAPGPAWHAGGVPVELLRFDCPRCERETDERLYGPCQRCRDELRARYSGEGREVAAPAYEPKVNVTPNAVATKD